MPKESYVISLEGEWGCGKSTILKHVINKISGSYIDVITDFDPWLYGSPTALLTGLYNQLLSKANLQFAPGKSERLLENIIKACTDTIAEKNISAGLFKRLAEIFFSAIVSVHALMIFSNSLSLFPGANCKFAFESN